MMPTPAEVAAADQAQAAAQQMAKVCRLLFVALRNEGFARTEAVAFVNTWLSTQPHQRS